MIQRVFRINVQTSKILANQFPTNHLFDRKKLYPNLDNLYKKSTFQYDKNKGYEGCKHTDYFIELSSDIFKEIDLCINSIKVSILLNTSNYNDAYLKKLIINLQQLKKYLYKKYKNWLKKNATN